RSLPLRGPIESRPIGGGHARLELRRPLGLPVSHELAVCPLALLSELPLALARLFERVRSGVAFLAALGGHAGAQLERPELLARQRWARERVVLTALDHRPAKHRELASSRDHGDLHTAAGTDPLIERTQRAWGLRRCPGGLHEHPAGMCPALLGDP